MTTSFILLGLCLFLSFFFSGTETAFTASSDALLHEMEKKGNKKAALVNKIKKKPDRFLGVILFGNNVVNIAATAITTSICIAILGPKLGVFVSTFVVSFVVLIFCEIMPKTIAIYRPNSISLLTSPVVAFLTFLLAPFIIFVNTVVKAFMRLLGLLHQEKIAGSQKTELRGVLNMQTDKNIQSEKNMMKSVLDLSEVSVGDIMTYRSKIVSFNVHTPMEKLLPEIAKCPYTRIPLWDNRKNNIVGILHTKLLLRALQSYQGDIKNFDVMSATQTPWFILETTSLLDQLHSFRRRHEHFAIVVDEYGEIQGILTLEDILEEIVGDIIDETDNQTESNPLFVTDANGAIIADGAASIRDLNRHFGWELPDEDASTLAGLLLYESERIPQKNATYSFFDFHFKILDKKANRITRVLITPPQKEED